MASRPVTNSARLRQTLSTVYESDTRSGSRLFQASSAIRIFWMAEFRSNGGTGGRTCLASIESSSVFGSCDAAHDSKIHMSPDVRRFFLIWKSVLSLLDEPALRSRIPSAQGGTPHAFRCTDADRRFIFGRQSAHHGWLCREAHDGCNNSWPVRQGRRQGGDRRC